VKDSITQHLKATGWFDAEEAAVVEVADEVPEYHTVEDLKLEVSELEKKMFAAAEALEFEKAAEYRDRIKALTEVMLAC
jgi:excinuclease UvrABC nuclease subunit